METTLAMNLRKVKILQKVSSTFNLNAENHSLIFERKEHVSMYKCV